MSFINQNPSETIFEKIIQANLADIYCIKLYQIILPYIIIKSINTCYLSHLFSDTKGCI